MVRVAVCDDDVYFTARVEDLILDYPLYQFEIDVYFDGDTLTKALDQGKRYELIFLDIKMERMDGIRAAQYLRRKDEDTVLVFISNYESYLRELFPMRPSAFLKKPLLPEEFRKCMKKALAEIDNRKVYYNYFSGFVNYKLCLKDILYFESGCRKIFIHTADRTDSFYEKLTNVERTIGKSTIPFLRIHQSFLVNYHYISGYRAAQMTLCNGEILPVSAERQKETRKKYHLLMELM